MQSKNKLCQTQFCRKPAKKNGLCYSCAQARYAEKHPFEYAYNTLKQNAKRRGKPFDLTLEEFKSFAIETDYINKRGRNQTGLTIDRIDPTKGYTKDNIQVLTNSGNVRKKAYIDRYYDPYQKRMEFYTSIRSVTPEPVFDCPF